MSLTLHVPAEYAYVLGVVTSTFFANSYHSLLTGLNRRAAKIPYPNCYASAEVAAKDAAAFKFNCAQRAHANFIENLTPFLGALLISGLRFPVASASLGAAWVVARIVYARGYVNGGPEGRKIGSIGSLFDMSLKLLSVYTVYTLLCQ